MLVFKIPTLRRCFPRDVDEKFLEHIAQEKMDSVLSKLLAPFGDGKFWKEIHKRNSFF